jgi:glucuronosyltransferase
MIFGTFLSFYYIPSQEALMKEHFKDLIPEPMPKLIDLVHDVDLVLLNSHPVTQYPRAHVPNSVEVGGIHLKTNEEQIHPVSFCLIILY